MRQLKKVLCPTDFSETARVAARYAVSLAQSQHAEIELLHVHHVPLHRADVHAPQRVEELPHALQHELKQRLAQLKDELATPGVTIRTDLAVGVPHEAINASAERLGVDLIVLGSHGHSRVARLLLGSVTDRVLRTATRPVLTVPAK
jgi:nucleotide-binding universal stress UspA family protein